MINRVSRTDHRVVGSCISKSTPRKGKAALSRALESLGRPLSVVLSDGELAVADDAQVLLGQTPAGDALPLLGWVPPLLPAQLGDASFLRDYGLTSAYVAGEMANGIASEALVECMHKNGMLGVFGAAGLSVPRVVQALDRLTQNLGPSGTMGRPVWGINLIHSPDDPRLEDELVTLFLDRQVRFVSASAFLDLTLPIVRYRVAGIHQDAQGNIVVPNRVMAKVSRTEVARKFLQPPPEEMLKALVDKGHITQAQAALAAKIPMADDLTAEADSGGHTDNRPLVLLLPALQALRDEVQATHGFQNPTRVGAAGGLATPASVCAAFAMGAAYAVTGSINQGCREAGTSDAVRQMLADCASTDVAMAPAADMFEMGVKVQVLSRGTLFAVRAGRLYELYRTYESVAALPAAVRTELEQKYFKSTLEEAWEGCRSFFQTRDPKQLERAAKEPKHQLALLFRAYLGQASRWANAGVPDRKLDYQVWCGPAMGAFNAWTRGSALERWEARDAVTVAHNLMCGAAYLTRVAALRAQGVHVPAELEQFAPKTADTLTAMQAVPAAQAVAGGVVSAAASPVASGDVAIASRGREEPIAIVGLGGIYPDSENLQAFFRLLRTAKDAVTDIPTTHWSLDDYYDADPKARDKTYAKRGAFMPVHAFDPTEFGIPPSIIEATDTSQLLGLVAARMAMEDAGYGDDVAWDKSRASVLLGVTGTQELVIALGARLGHPKWRKALLDSGIEADLAEEVVERISRSYVGWQENSFPGLLGNVVAGRIANRLDFGGTNSVVDAACASSLGAVHLAMLELRSGKSDLVLTGGVDSLNDIFMHMCFSKTPALSASGDVRPFSAKADGTLLGEAMGMLVLKRLSDAERDGDRVYATIRGMGTSSDGRAKSIYAPLPQGQARALRAAYHEANVRPRDIDLIEAHGTGTKAGDLAEMEALNKVYRDDSADPAWCAIGSVKSQVGHTKAAAGAVGVTKAALALHHKLILPTIKVEAPNPAMKISESPFSISTETRPWIKREAAPRLAAVSSFGFGGSNYHLVLEEHGTTRREPAWDGGLEIVALSAPSKDALLARCTQAAAWTLAERARNAAESRAQFQATHAYRLLMVLGESELPKALVEAAVARIAKAPDASFSLPEGAHYGVGKAPGGLAFVFPGQGAQHVNMLRELSCIFPEMLASLSMAPGVAHAVYPAPTFDEGERKAREERLTKTNVAQPAIGAVSKGALDVLARFGIKPNLVAGHSYGELVALHAAGVLDDESLVAVSALRGSLMAGNGEDRGTMLAVLAPLADIERAIDEAKLGVVLANRNGPAQGVVSGSRADIDAAEAAFKARNLRCTRLSVGAAFHSSLVAGAATEFRKGLGSVSFRTPNIPVVANTTAKAYPAAADDARDLLGNQLAKPVRWDDVVRELYVQGARTFVEVGPRTALTGMVKAILADQSHVALSLDAQSKRGGLGDLATLLCRLAALGHTVDLSPWQAASLPPRSKPKAPRKPKMVVPLTGANHRNPEPPMPPRAPRPAQPVAQLSAAAVSPRAAQTSPPISQARPSLGAQTPVSAPVSSTALTLSPATMNGRHETQRETIMSKKDSFTPTGHVHDLLRANLEAVRALQAQQEQTARIHQSFLEGQLHAQQSFHALLTGQQQLAQFQPVVSSPPTLTNGYHPVSLPAQTQAAVPVTTPAARPVAAAPVPAPAPAPAPYQAQAPVSTPVSVAAPTQAQPKAQPKVDFVAALLEVVAQTTGYPQETLELSMDMEADLGIDSIKRVEILSLLSKRIPGAPQVNPEKLSALKTLQQVLDFIQAGVGAGSAPAATAAAVATSGATAAPGLSSADVQRALLEVVAQTTGYPQETLELSMDMEADLGIDSIKRVEILSLLSKRIPGAPQVNPEKLSALKTLQQVLDFIHAGASTQGGPSAHAAPPAALAASAPSAGASSAEVVTALLEVVAQTTGYPQETLELSMDMEADLGIDSIKRVEILSLLSKRVPGAPQVNPEKLSALKTLQQVVDFIAQGGVKNTMPSPAVPTAAQPSVASVGPSTQASAAAAPDAHALSRRLVLPVRMEARKADAPKFPAHEILVHDGGHPLATALVAALVALGAKARTFKDAAEVTSAVGGLVVLPAASASWSASTENALKDNLRIARSFGPRLVDTGVAGAAFFACVSLRDGAFGHALPSAGLSPLDGGSAGLIKSAAHEWPEVRCAAFDVHHSMPVADMARELALELGALGQHKAQEIGLGPAGRMTLGLREVATPVAAPSLSATDVVVVTGGARGVTADCARALALATGARLLLLGRSPAPTGEPSWLAQATDEASVKRALLDNAKPGDKPTPKMLGEACRGILAAREIQKSLELLAASGVTAAYRAVDVRDEDALGRVLAEARASLGPIRGVVHGAGVLRDKRIVDKRDDDIDQVVDTKLAGLRALLAATRSDDLKVLALFASVSGRFGRRGQSDYALANQALVSIAQAEAFARPNCRVAALDWGPWDGGMVTPALRTEFQREGVGLIGLDAGADAMVRELGLAPSRHVEVVLGAGFGQDDVALPSGTWTLASVHHLDPATHPVLADHRLGGKAVLPFALSLEWMAEAARSVLALGGPVSLEDARVLRGVTLDASPEDVCVWVSDKDAAGRATVELRSTKDQVYVRAQVPASAAGTTAPMDDPGHLAPYGRPVAKIYGTELFHGPSLEAVESIEGVSAEGMLLHLRTQETSARLLPGPARPFLLDPFALDGVFQALILWCRASRGAPSLPSSIARITRLRPFASAEPVRVSVRVREVDGAIVRSDVELSDAQGVALRLEGYSCTVSPSLDKAFQEGSAALAATSS